MDAVGFIASVAQLAGAGLSLSKALYEYASSVSNAPKKLNDLAQDVKLTSSVLEHLGEVFSEATVRAFVRPGALHTAQDAVAGCSGIFAEMEMLIEEGRKGLGKFILPFKESKIQLLNARLASLKSTLQLLLQGPKYQPIESQRILVMSQFKILIDEREEAKRNFEQLKAEIGSVNSGIGEPSNGSSNAQQKPPSANVAETSEIQFAAYNGQNLPSFLPGSMPFTGEPQESSPKRILTDMLRCVVRLLCCPCYYFFGRPKQSRPNAPAFPMASPAAPYPYGHVGTAYENLETYGPEAIFEFAMPISTIAPLSLPAPAELDSYYHS